MSDAYDVVIVGAGITGLTLAAGLKGSGLRVALIVSVIAAALSIGALIVWLTL